MVNGAPFSSNQNERSNFSSFFFYLTTNCVAIYFNLQLKSRFLHQIYFPIFIHFTTFSWHLIFTLILIRFVLFFFFSFFWSILAIYTDKFKFGLLNRIDGRKTELFYLLQERRNRAIERTKQKRE